MISKKEYKKAKMKNWKAAASNWIARAETDFAGKDKPAFQLKLTDQHNRNYGI